MEQQAEQVSQETPESAPAQEPAKDTGPLTTDNPNISLEGREVKGPIDSKPPEPAETVEDVMKAIDDMGMELRKLIVRCKKLPKGREYVEPYQDPVRSIAQAQAYLQVGLMWLRRGVEVPKIF